MKKKLSLKYEYISKMTGVDRSNPKYISTSMEDVKVNRLWVKKFDGTSMAYAELSAGAMVLLNYMTERMDEENYVYLDIIAKKRYMSKINKSGKRKVTNMSGLRRLVKELVDKDMLKVISRGSYYVNPLYFTRGMTMARRTDSIRAWWNSKYYLNESDAVPPGLQEYV